MTDTSYADTAYTPYGTTPDTDTGAGDYTSPVDATTPEPAIDKSSGRNTGRRAGGRRKTAAPASIDKATVVKVLDTRTRVEQMNDTMRGIVAAVSRCDNDADSLTVGLLGDTSWIESLAAVRDLTEQDSFDALVEVADMKPAERNDIWTVLHDLSGTEKARLNSSVGKAARQVIEAVNSVDAGMRDAITEILTLVAE